MQVNMQSPCGDAPMLQGDGSMRPLATIAFVLITAFSLPACASYGERISSPTEAQSKEDLSKSVKPAWETLSPARNAWIEPQGATKPSEDLSQWWKSFNDPLLSRILEATQTNNPSLTAAVARIETAKANLRAAQSGAWPRVDVSTSAQAAKQPASPRVTNIGLGLEAGWEVDLFGAIRRGEVAAGALVEASRAEYRDVLLSLNASVATLYVALKACEQNLQIQQLELNSQKTTLDLTELKVKAGLSAPAEASLLRASVANSQNGLTALELECDLLVNTLSTISQLPGNSIKEDSKRNFGQLPKPASFKVQSLPLSLLQQRPDLIALERQLIAVSEQIGIARANQLPRLRLGGNLTFGASRAAGVSTEGLGWGFGPSLSLPLFDGGQRAAAVDAAQARRAEVLAAAQMKLQAAVSEVQEAIFRIDAASQRSANADRAAAEFEAFFKAAQTRWQVGVGSLLELEEARRLAANAKVAQIRLEQDRLTQWINLYRAIGGGWSN